MAKRTLPLSKVYGLLQPGPVVLVTTAHKGASQHHDHDSAKKKICEFLIANVGKIVTSKEIPDVSGIIAHARRVPELRDKEGMANPHTRRM